MSEWQPISTAPKDGTKILTWTPSGYYAGIAINHWDTRYARGAWWNSAASDPPTHWMPLPAPPKPPGIMDIDSDVAD